jgi:hypothetical protein
VRRRSWSSARASSAHHEARQGLAQDESHVGRQVVAVDALSTEAETAERRLILIGELADEVVHVLCEGGEAPASQLPAKQTPTCSLLLTDEDDVVVELPLVLGREAVCAIHLCHLLE